MPQLDLRFMSVLNALGNELGKREGREAKGRQKEEKKKKRAWR